MDCSVSCGVEYSLGRISDGQINSDERACAVWHIVLTCSWCVYRASWTPVAVHLTTLRSLERRRSEKERCTANRRQGKDNLQRFCSRVEIFLTYLAANVSYIIRRCLEVVMQYWPGKKSKADHLVPNTLKFAYPVYGNPHLLPLRSCTVIFWHALCVRQNPRQEL